LPAKASSKLSLAQLKSWHIASACDRDCCPANSALADFCWSAALAVTSNLLAAVSRRSATALVVVVVAVVLAGSGVAALAGGSAVTVLILQYAIREIRRKLLLVPQFLNQIVSMYACLCMTSIPIALIILLAAAFLAASDISHSATTSSMNFLAAGISRPPASTTNPFVLLPLHSFTCLRRHSWMDVRVLPGHN
jgi:hypothetical protein